MKTLWMGQPPNEWAEFVSDDGQVLHMTVADLVRWCTLCGYDPEHCEVFGSDDTHVAVSPKERGTMRRFLLRRDVDVTGISGTGFVAEGVEFSDGITVVHWRGEHASTVVWETLDDVIAIHGHNGQTTVQWLEDED